MASGRSTYIKRMSLSSVTVLCVIFSFASQSLFAAPTVPKATSAADIDWFPDDDRKAYELMLSAYQKQDLKLLSRFHARFLKTFSQSPLKDNATYLVAQLCLEQGLWKKAIAPLNSVLKSELISERWPSALYAKGLVYQKLGMNKRAGQQWQILLKRFPGSKESQKAWISLRLMNAEIEVN